MRVASYLLEPYFRVTTPKKTIFLQDKKNTSGSFKKMLTIWWLLVLGEVLRVTANCPNNGATLTSSLGTMTDGNGNYEPNMDCSGLSLHQGFLQ